MIHGMYLSLELILYIEILFIFILDMASETGRYRQCIFEWEIVRGDQYGGQDGKQKLVCEMKKAFYSLK